jgi:hypothetical protein
MIYRESYKVVSYVVCIVQIAVVTTCAKMGRPLIPASITLTSVVEAGTYHHQASSGLGLRHHHQIVPVQNLQGSTIKITRVATKGLFTPRCLPEYRFSAHRRAVE